MRILVTRPREDAAALVAELAARGHEALLEPLLTIVPRDKVDWPAGHERAQALLVTSANGVRAFARADGRRDLPVYAVGDASAAEARALGFEAVVSAVGDVHDLAALVTARLDGKAGPLLHPAASTVAGDLRGMLAAAGFEVLRVVLYDARPATALSPQTAQAIRQGAVDAVALMSPRTAAAFTALTAAVGLEAACAGMTAFCLSDAVARALGATAWRRVAVAARPDQTSMLATIDAEAAARG